MKIHMDVLAEWFLNSLSDDYFVFVACSNQAIRRHVVTKYLATSKLPKSSLAALRLWELTFTDHDGTSFQQPTLFEDEYISCWELYWKFESPFDHMVFVTYEIRAGEAIICAREDVSFGFAADLLSQLGDQHSPWLFHRFGARSPVQAADWLRRYGAIHIFIVYILHLLRCAECSALWDGMFDFDSTPLYCDEMRSLYEQMAERAYLFRSQPYIPSNLIQRLARYGIDTPKRFMMNVRDVNRFEKESSVAFRSTNRDEPGVGLLKVLHRHAARDPNLVAVCEPIIMCNVPDEDPSFWLNYTHRFNVWRQDYLDSVHRYRLSLLERLAFKALAKRTQR